MSSIDQVLRGRVGFSMGGNPTVTVDTQNGSVISDSIISNSSQTGTIEPLDPLLPVINVSADLVFPNNSYGLIFGVAPNESAIYATGADLFIEAPGNVVINNLDLSNVNVNVNLDGINSALNNLNNDVLNLQNEDANLSNSIANAYNQANSAFNGANSAFNTANSAFNQANSAFNGANSAFNTANSALNIANSAYNQANSATILAGNAYNQANSYLNSLNTNQLILSSTELIFKANLSSSPQVSLNSNGATLPFFSVERTFGGDTAQSIVEPLSLYVSHNITSTASDEQPYLVMTDINAITQVGIYSGPNVPSFVATGGSLYLQNDGQFYTYDGANWASQALGGKITCKDILVRDNANSNTIIHIDPANISGLVINTNGGSETPQITVDKFNSSSDGISVLSHENLTVTHIYSVEDQNYPYVQFFDSASTALINASIYFGRNVPTHTSLVGNGSLFLKGGPSPGLYLFNGSAWSQIPTSITTPPQQRVLSIGKNVDMTNIFAGSPYQLQWNLQQFEQNSLGYFRWPNPNSPRAGASTILIEKTATYLINCSLAIQYPTSLPAQASFEIYIRVYDSSGTLVDNLIDGVDIVPQTSPPSRTYFTLQLSKYKQLNINDRVEVWLASNTANTSTVFGTSLFADQTYLQISIVD
jgi:hypothetical protein